MPGKSAETKFATSINQGSISADDGLPSFAHSISIQHMERETEGRLSYSILRTLLENTPRKLGSVRLESFRPVQSSPEYLDFLTCICTKAERLSFDYAALSQTAEIERLATGLAQPDGPRQLTVDLHSFHTRERKRNLQQLFQLIGSCSLDALDMRTIPDLSEHDLGTVLSESLRTNRTLKTLVLDGHWGHGSHMIVEKVMCSILEHTPVENLRLISRNFRSSLSDIGDDKTARRFFEKLATARTLKNFELNRNLLLESESYMDAFEDALCRNRCLERLYMFFDYRDVRKTEWRKRHDQRIYIRLCMNRAARELDHSTALGLWPHVLHRAGRITYYPLERNGDCTEQFFREDERHSPASERSRAAVVYTLLKERVLLS